MNNVRIGNALWVALSIATALISVNAAAQSRKPIDVEKARVVEHWTAERRAAAIPRDLRIDPRGLGYMRRPDGSLVPYGHNVEAQAAPSTLTPSPFAKPSGGGSSDTTGPTVSLVNPAAGAIIGASYTFSANVTDPSGVRSVSFKIQKGSSRAQSFGATKGSNDVWSVSLQGFTDGSWSWQVVAKDNASGGGNTSTSPKVNFTVNTSSSGGGGNTVTNSEWTAAGAVQTAAGRIYFDMPDNANRTVWNGYVCSGTVASDGTSGRSIIITAAHCVYDDANKAFARSVMFIPNQDETTASGTDRTCGNDPLGCWVPSFGVVDVNWTTRTFPDNIAWDYAFYVVNDSGAHRAGFNSASDLLDSAAGSLAVQFTSVNVNDGTAGGGTPDFTHALGYSYSDDPKFMYCAEDMTTEGAYNWWLPSCGLSGGSSGGPWIQPMTSGGGPIISVNSWGYTGSPGMAGPKLSGNSASNIFAKAKCLSLSNGDKPAGDAGVKVSSSTACP